MKFQIQKDSFKLVETKKITFNIADSKGRKVGASAMIFSQVLQPVPQEEIDRGGWFHWVMEGAEELSGTTVYGYEPQALRDGNFFGSSHACKRFFTEAERDAAVAKYFANAEKRAAKAAART
jgi:hypothetical protein